MAIGGSRATWRRSVVRLIVALGVAVAGAGCGPTPPGPTPPASSPTPASTVAPLPAGTSEVRGTVLFSPVCPVERLPPDPACAPRPGPADVDLVRPDGTVAAGARAGDDGAFVLPVAPGLYRVRPTAPGSAIGGGCQSDPADIVVAPGKVATVAVTCDTGIR